MRRFYLFALCLSGTFSIYAQPSLHKLNESINKQRQESSYNLRLFNPTQGALLLHPGSRLLNTEVRNWLSAALDLRKGRDELRKSFVSTQRNDLLEVEKYQQYYQGVKVEHGVVNVLSHEGRVAALQMEFYSLDEAFSTAPKLTQAEAFERAIAHVGATRYMWEDYTGSDAAYQKPTGELVIVEDYFGAKGKLQLAYKFDIYAEQPLSRSYVYISAYTGAVLLVDRIIKHISPDIDGRIASSKDKKGERAGVTSMLEEKPLANAAGAGQTRYSGTQSFFTDDGSGTSEKPYRLRQVRNGDNIITLNYERRTRSSTNDAAAIDFTDNDNNWTTAEHSFNYDDAALDAHHASQIVSDYWHNVHGRNSWNNTGGQIRSYVHVRSSAEVGYDNAFWTGAAMYFGDGTYYSSDGLGTVVNANGFKPLTSLDVVAHELGHGVCDKTAGLVYQRESGAINEGFSDIWGACAEAFSGLPKSPFLIGEEITPSSFGGALRNMQNPKQFGHPDTYMGQNWRPTTLGLCPTPNSNTDYCGVHRNSGVLNKWFYLLTQGGSGTNDNGDAYAVVGLGFSKAEKIAYLTEQNLTPNADYAATRVASINAAAALYGNCSNEVIQVIRAWYAVGVGETPNCTPAVEFVKAKMSVTEGPGVTGNAGTSQTLSIPVKLGTASSKPTNVTFKFSGTAIRDVHYTVEEPELLFAAGEEGSKELRLAILDNATLDGNKTIVVTYTIQANGGEATAGTTNQSCTVNISDDDMVPAPIRAAPITVTTLLNENFDAQTPGTSFPTGWDQDGAYTGGNSSVNKWVIGADGGNGITGHAAYVSKTSSTTLSYGYDVSSNTDRRLRLPVLNTTGLTDIRLSFKYKVDGEGYGSGSNYPGIWDFGRIMYDSTSAGTSFLPLFHTAENGYFALWGHGSNVQQFEPYPFPSSVEDKPAVYIAFRWTNDNADGSGLPLLIDEVVVTGKTRGVSTATTTNHSKEVRIVAGNRDTYITANDGSNLLVKLSNLSESVAALTATAMQVGGGRIAVKTANGSFFRTQKVIQLTPDVSSLNPTYVATLYFTTADLASWSPTEIPLLKILKVKDGVDLNGVLTAADVEVITPTFSNHSADGYYSYTGNVKGFSQFMLVSSSFTLPIHLLTFEAQPGRRNVTLLWRTASEENNKGFEIERSVDGVDYSVIGWVKGAGTSLAVNSYHYTDNFVQPNTIYHYRLKQVDIDNQTKYSFIRQARISADGVTISVNPNPAKNMMRVFVSGGTLSANISLINSKGQRAAFWGKVNTGSVFELDITRFAKGHYTLVIHLPDGDRTTQVLIQ